ncbi:hypothetical protein KBQ18_08205 [Klebsiella aerogenes]|uniref:hypothetical protein n=1 Tax=Klebsiella aerogenes TaxID=548 RepID=UPI0015E945E0|nr:hypothetical protein [Klebsiella aerogenes]MCT2785223.1 hypothetical protein [Klebsiella aerogenes]MCT2805443.1 hypothetical protein [Klebsiella aerogenes]MCT2811763.1 hypothetical protein [Klebsiella aerogenes]MCT2848240.1 hypothetical protein [Klebsiella aerogenes]QLS46458.1 hypothetical protein HV316_19850 [Klebsiella aerogenes]
MMNLLIIALGVIVGFPLLVAAISFVTWENGFRVIGRGYIIRTTILLIVISWVIYFIPGGTA